MQYLPVMIDDGTEQAAHRHRQPKYRDLAPAVALVTGLALLMVGIIWWRLDVTIPLSPRTAVAAGTSVKPPPTPSAPRRAKVVEPVSAPIAVETEAVAVTPEAPVVPVKPAKIAPPSRALASAPQKVAAIECPPPPAADAYNVDPTGGDLAGTAAAPSRVMYFKHGKKPADALGKCRAPALAGNASH